MAEERRRQLRSDVTGSSRFWVQLEREEVIGLLDDVDRLEGELRLARELLRRVRNDAWESLEEYDGWTTNHSAANAYLMPDKATEDEQAALVTIRRDVEEGQDG